MIALPHEYEVKKVHVDGAEFFAVVFYLRAGEPGQYQRRWCAQAGGPLVQTRLFLIPLESTV